MGNSKVKTATSITFVVCVFIGSWIAPTVLGFAPNRPLEFSSTSRCITASPREQHAACTTEKQVPWLLKKNFENRHCVLFLSSESLSQDDGESSEAEESNTNDTKDAVSVDSENGKVPRWKRLLRAMKLKKDEDDGLTFRQQLAKMGLAAVLSYGWVSNMSYSVTVSIAWYLFSKQTGKSPLAPGQWKGFLAVYAGFWVFNNIVRPVRVAAAVAISPMFDRIVLRIQEKFRVSKTVAIAITVFVANLIGTTFFMCSGIALASLLSGVPIFAGRS